MLSISNNVSTYSLNCLQRLQRDELTKVCFLLNKLFCQWPAVAGSCAAWSYAADLAGHRVGEIYVVEGGHQGRGELSMRAVSHPHGIFKE